MRALGNTLCTLALVATVAAIWTPLHWQFAATALLLLLAGAIIHGSRQAVADQVVGATGMIEQDVVDALDRRAKQMDALYDRSPRTYGKRAN